MEDLIKCYCGHTTTCDCIPEQERSYSEEIIDILDNVRYWETCPNKYKVIIEEWFNKFKKK